MTASHCPTRAADVVVIGAGITGCSAAYYLARRGVKVTLVEKDDIASEQSSRAWGFIRQQGRHPAEMPLAKAANALWGHLPDELEADIEFVPGGILVLAETDADMDRLEQSAKVASECAIETRTLPAREISDLVPGISGRWRANRLWKEKESSLNDLPISMSLILK